LVAEQHIGAGRVSVTDDVGKCFLHDLR
jgi:hypothetical protein